MTEEMSGKYGILSVTFISNDCTWNEDRPGV